MKSLVEELRAGAELEEVYDADGIIRTGYQLSLRWRAAAEIERLREALKPMTEGLYWLTHKDVDRAREALGDE